MSAAESPAASSAPVGSREARRSVALILEALGGLRSAPEAADAMGVALARYYVLERRAVQGMVTALEPRKRGRQVSLESQIEKLEREIERLSGEVLRYQTLHRASQRVIGVPREEPAAPSSRRKTKRTARARRKKSRAEKILPRVAPEETGGESPPLGAGASEAPPAPDAEA